MGNNPEIIHFKNWTWSWSWTWKALNTEPDITKIFKRAILQQCFTGNLVLTIFNILNVQQKVQVDEIISHVNKGITLLFNNDTSVW